MIIILNGINIVEGKLSSAIYSIRTLKNLILCQTLHNLYYSFAYSHLQYGIFHWGNKYIPAYKLKRIKSKQEKIIKILSQKAKVKDSTNSFKELKLLHFDDIVKLEYLKFMYKYNNKNLPISLNNLFVKDQNYGHNCLMQLKLPKISNPLNLNVKTIWLINIKSKQKTKLKIFSISS